MKLHRYQLLLFNCTDISQSYSYERDPLETINSVIMKTKKNDKEFVFILHPEATYGESFDACLEILNTLIEMQKKLTSSMEKKESNG